MTTPVFTALKPTGPLQVGNYFGAIRPLLALAGDGDHDVVVAVADLHALTVAHRPAELRARTLEVAATLVACGLDERATLFVQSSVPSHTELGYLLESTATYGEMRRMVQFKEKSDGRGSARLSLLTYPALMAADILAHRAELVPVGDDQQQHLELAVTLARRFNRHYGSVFVVPRGLTTSTAARIRDLRDPSAKMGKSGSDGSGVVYLSDEPAVIAAKVRRAVTDGDPVLSFDPETRPGVANLAVLLGACTQSAPQQALADIHGAAALKRDVAEALIEVLRPIRERYDDLMRDPGLLRDRLALGADAASREASETVAEARDAIGLMSVR